MLRRFIGALLVVAAIATSAAASRSDDFYLQYEALNSEKNLDTTYVGGRPPGFVEQQLKLLDLIGKEPVAQARPVVLRIADEFFKRIGTLGEVKFRQSPLQAMQMPIITLIERHSAWPEAMMRLELFAKSPVVSEYARARALGGVAGRRVSEIAPAGDPEGVARGKVLLDLLVGDLDRKSVV